MDRPAIPMLYADAVSLIRDGDIALYRVPPVIWWKPWTWIKLSNFLISMIGRTFYIHAGMLVITPWSKINPIWMMETIQWLGGRAIPFADMVERHPGQWDIYRPKPPYDGSKAVEEMARVVNKKYGWGNLVVSSLRHTRIISRFLPPFTDDQLNGSAPFCSQAVSKASRAGGRDPRPNCSDIATEPGHLASPDYANPVCRVYWDRTPEAER